jgi:hypothetical protein
LFLPQGCQLIDSERNRGDETFATIDRALPPNWNPNILLNPDPCQQGFWINKRTNFCVNSCCPDDWLPNLIEAKEAGEECWVEDGRNSPVIIWVSPYLRRRLQEFTLVTSRVRGRIEGWRLTQPIIFRLVPNRLSRLILTRLFLQDTCLKSSKVNMRSDQSVDIYLPGNLLSRRFRTKQPSVWRGIKGRNEDR